MFEPWVNSSGQKILQASFCLVNINTRYACATTKNTRVLLNNKDASLVLRSFKRMLENMQHEAAV